MKLWLIENASYKLYPDEHYATTKEQYKELKRLFLTVLSKSHFRRTANMSYTSGDLAWIFTQKLGFAVSNKDIKQMLAQCFIPCGDRFEKYVNYPLKDSFYQKLIEYEICS